MFGAAGAPRTVRIGGFDHPVIALADDGRALRGFVARRIAPSTIARAIALIVDINLAHPRVKSLNDAWDVALSPIWERGPDGNVIRRAALLSRSMRAHYFGSAAAALLTGEQIADVIDAMARSEDARHPRSELLRLYSDSSTPFVDISIPWTADLAGLSLILADAARCARVGATPAQLVGDGLTHDQSKELTLIEDQFVRDLCSAPVDELADAFGRA